MDRYPVDRDYTRCIKRRGGMVIRTHTGAACNQDDIGAGGHNRRTNGCKGAINAALLDEETTVAGN